MDMAEPPTRPRRAIKPSEKLKGNPRSSGNDVSEREGTIPPIRVPCARSKSKASKSAPKETRASKPKKGTSSRASGIDSSV